jgi:hypothetical protein
LVEPPAAVRGSNPNRTWSWTCSTPKDIAGIVLFLAGTPPASRAWATAPDGGATAWRRALMLGLRTEGGQAAMRLHVGLAVAWALVGCAPDYAAVRDWSTQARDIVLPLDMPRVPAGPPVLLAPPPPVTLEGRAGAAQALREGISTWFAYLALLADDIRPPTEGAAVEALAPAVEPFDPVGAAALRGIGRLMDHGVGQGWRAATLPNAVEHGDAYVQTAIAALRRQLDLLAAEQDADPRRHAARLAILDQVGAGHALLKRRSAILAQAETARLLRAQESELRRLILLAVTG